MQWSKCIVSTIKQCTALPPSTKSNKWDYGSQWQCAGLVFTNTCYTLHKAQRLHTQGFDFAHLKDFILHTQGFILYTQGFNFVHSRISCAQNFRLTELVPLLLSLYSIQWAVSSGHSQIQQDWIQGLFINIALEGESSDKSVRQPRSFIPHPAFDCREFS